MPDVLQLHPCDSQLILFYLQDIMLKILAADDHPLFREGIRHFLLTLDSEVIILEAGSLQNTLEILRENSDIDLILLDLIMPGMNGLEGLRVLDECNPMIPIIILSASEDPDDISHTLAQGATGYIPKSSSSSVVIQAIKQVLAGEIYKPEILCKQESYQNPCGCLTHRQQEVLRLMVEGLSNKAIADKLFVSERTIKHHIAAIFRMLAVENRVQAMAKIRKLDLQI